MASFKDLFFSRRVLACVVDSLFKLQLNYSVSEEISSDTRRREKNSWELQSVISEEEKKRNILHLRQVIKTNSHGQSKKCTWGWKNYFLSSSLNAHPQETTKQFHLTVLKSITLNWIVDVSWEPSLDIFVKRFLFKAIFNGISERVNCISMGSIIMT